MKARRLYTPTAHWGSSELSDRCSHSDDITPDNAEGKLRAFAKSKLQVAEAPCAPETIKLITSATSIQVDDGKPGWRSGGPRSRFESGFITLRHGSPTGVTRAVKIMCDLG